MALPALENLRFRAINSQKTIADSLTLQSRPISGEGLIGLFKVDPQKKLDKEQNVNVGAVLDYLVGSFENADFCSRYKASDNDLMILDTRASEMSKSTTLLPLNTQMEISRKPSSWWCSLKSLSKASSNPTTPLSTCKVPRIVSLLHAILIHFYSQCSPDSPVLSQCCSQTSRMSLGGGWLR